MNENVSAWLSSVDGLPEVHARMCRVEVRLMDAIEFIKLYDHPRAFFFIDPPYLVDEEDGDGNTVAIRTSGGGEYAHEWTFEQHVTLLSTLTDIEGYFMLCGYPSRLYTAYTEDFKWRNAHKLVTKSSSRSKLKPFTYEHIWMNYAPDGSKL